MCANGYPSSECHTECFHRPKNPMLRPSLPPSPLPPGKPRSLCCLHSFAFFRTSSGWNHTVRGLCRLAFHLNAYHPCLCMAWQFSVLIFHHLSGPRFISPPPDGGGHLDRFQVWAIMTKTALNSHGMVFVWMLRFQLQVNIGAVAGSYGGGMFSFIRNCPAVFQTGSPMMLPTAASGSPCGSTPSSALGSGRIWATQQGRGGILLF